MEKDSFRSIIGKIRKSQYSRDSGRDGNTTSVDICTVFDYPYRYKVVSEVKLGTRLLNPNPFR